jgi:hypothetical protein
MKKIILILLAIFLLGIVPVSFADRNISTIKGYTASALVKRGDWKIYRITFIATTAVGSFTIYDSLTKEAGSNTNVKAEGGEATVGNSKVYDFTNKPLEGSTGLYLVVVTGNVVVEYE